MKADSILATIGNTPHIRLSRLFPDAEVWVKAERANPGGSIKDRIALAMIEAAEQGLRDLGFTELRVRHHGDVALIELPIRELARILDPWCRSRVIGVVLSTGYRFVALDLEGFRSGSLNRGVAEAAPKVALGPPTN